MKSKFPYQSTFFNLHILVALVAFFASVFIALIVTAGPGETARQAGAQLQYANRFSVASSGAVQQQWVAHYPSAIDNQAFAIAVDGSGNVYVVTGDSATVKYNSTGQQQWAAYYPGTAKAMAVDGSENVYVTGGNPGTGNSDYATIKYNSAGQQQWIVTYNGPGNGDDHANAIAIDGSGNVYVTGASVGGDGYPHYATIKYNSAGQQQWVARYTGPALLQDEAAAIAVDGLGNVYVTGSSNEDYATIKYNAVGEQQWVARYDGGYQDFANAIAIDDSGNVYVTGYSGFDYATVKYDSSGGQLWIARYHGPGSGGAVPAAIAVDGRKLWFELWLRLRHG
jgi:hypothetical protein